MPSSSLMFQPEDRLHHCGATFPVTVEIKIQERVVEFAHSDLSELIQEEGNCHFIGL